MDNDYTIAAVDRALKILKLFDANHSKMTLIEVSSLSGLNKSSVLRILYTLRQNDFIKYDERTKEYSLGLSVFKLGNCAYYSMDISKISKPYLHAIANKTDMVIHLGVMEQESVVIIAKVYPDKEIVWPRFRSNVGGIMPAYCTGIGRLFLAHLSPEKLEYYFEHVELKRFTPTTVTAREELDALIAAARENNVDFCDCEHEAFIYSISAPIYDISGKMIAGVSIGGFREMFTDEVIRDSVELVKSVGCKISRDFGYEGEYR